ncbi:MAG: sensor domain-containing diguanylate cyclase [Thermoleophilia bacterium]|nr:sensor domain-containing diguanylate cyclase [Thermoleophilia bacterium]
MRLAVDLHRVALGRQLAPFGVVSVLALATVAVPPHPADWWLVVGAAALTALVIASSACAPWGALPRWTHSLPPLAYFVVVGLLREAQGGSVSGYSVLVLLPVVWVALTLGPWEVALTVVATAATIVSPLFLGSEIAYPTSDWRRAVLLTTTAAVVGYAVNSLVRQAQHQADLSDERAEALAVSEATIAAVMRVTRALDGDARRHACSAARELSEASFVVIAEPTADGSLSVTASDGIAGPVPPVTQRGGASAAFSRCQRLVVLDAATDDHVSHALREATGTGSVVFEPIIHRGRAVGVLVVGWDKPLAALPIRVEMALELLAAEVATAIERDDLVARLQQASVTDELTGLPNRRRWEEELPRALARARRTGAPVSLVMLDLDHFKEFNDRRGHQAGDALLRDAAVSWQAALRAGDMLARYGGEEFAAVIFDGDLASARRTADRLRAATPRGQTCSAGVATWDGQEGPDDLVRRADGALYAAKRRGRDRTETASPLGVVDADRSAGAA